MTALMNAEASKDVERAAELINEAKGLGIDVLAPDINQSIEGFAIAKTSNHTEAIRFGLTAIKNVGGNFVKTVIEERVRNDAFRSLEDFITRIESRDLNKKSLESLIKAGALDQLGERKTMLENIERLLEFSRFKRRNKMAKQESLFGLTPALASKLELLEVIPASSQEKLKWEKELIGLYVSGHPLEVMQTIAPDHLKECQPIKKLHENPGERRVQALGILTTLKRTLTRQGKPMLFGKLEDKSASIELVIFPATAESYASHLRENAIVLVKGKANQRNGIISLIVDSIADAEQLSVKRSTVEV